MKCARRETTFAAAFVGGEDEWLSTADGACCSYCGSMTPEAFFAALESGKELIPTDKSYKAYVGTGRHGQAKFYFEHLDAAQKKRFVELYNAKAIKLGYPGYLYVWPYFMRPAEKKVADA